MQAARGASLSPSEQATPVPGRARALRSLFLTVAVVGYALDQVSKQWALTALEDRDISVVGDLLVLHLTFNPGAAFSTGTEFTIVFTCLAIVAVAVIGWVSRRLGSTVWAWALGILLAGVAGNLTDRLVREPGFMHGHVIDFLMLPNWPVFNIADICINVGAGLIILQSFRGIGIDGRRDADDRVSDAGSGDAGVDGSTP